jgi:hypothetical protein
MDDDPKYRKIDRSEPVEMVNKDGKRFVKETSTVRVGKDDELKNSRDTKEGERADQKVRDKWFVKTGYSPGHVQPTQLGIDPSDEKNVKDQNPLQNLTGGTGAAEEDRFKKRVQQPAVSGEREVESKYSLDRKGYGRETPIARKVTHTFHEDGKPDEKSELYLGNFSSSTSREAAKIKGLTDEEKAKRVAEGLPADSMSSPEAKKLLDKDRAAIMPKHRNLTSDDKNHHKAVEEVNRNYDKAAASGGDQKQLAADRRAELRAMLVDHTKESYKTPEERKHQKGVDKLNRNYDKAVKSGGDANQNAADRREGLKSLIREHTKAINKTTDKGRDK